MHRAHVLELSVVHDFNQLNEAAGLATDKEIRRANANVDDAIGRRDLGLEVKLAILRIVVEHENTVNEGAHQIFWARLHWASHLLALDVESLHGFKIEHIVHLYIFIPISHHKALPRSANRRITSVGDDKHADVPVFLALADHVVEVKNRIPAVNYQFIEVFYLDSEEVRVLVPANNGVLLAVGRRVFIHFIYL